MANEEEDPIHREILWRQYASSVDLYKHYTDLVLKTNGFFYLTTGGIMTYYLANTDKGLTIFSLILPILAGFILGGGFIYGAHLLKAQKEDIKVLSKKLGLDLKAELGILGAMFVSSGSGFFLVGIVLMVLIFIKMPGIKTIFCG